MFWRALSEDASRQMKHNYSPWSTTERAFRASLLNVETGVIPTLAAHRLPIELLYVQPFWQPLFAHARRCTGFVQTKTENTAKTTIAIEAEGKLHKICKVVPLADGGFALTMPYHRARVGWLMKVRIGPKRGVRRKISRSAWTLFHASDRVKLSYHADGFVQFSGERQGKIRSGRDRRTGIPKGLGLMSNPLYFPIESGPSVGCLVWGISDFSLHIPRPSESLLIFRDGDFYTIPQDKKFVTEGYAFSFFVFPGALLERAIGPVHTGDEIEMPIPMNIYHHSLFVVKLIRISPTSVLGVIVNRQRVGFPDSGFQLGGPGDGVHIMFAQYPAGAMENDGSSLDFC